MKLKAYVVMFKTDEVDYPTIKIYRRKYDAEQFLSNQGWYEDPEGHLRWFHPNLSKFYEARIEKFIF